MGFGVWVTVVWVCGESSGFLFLVTKVFSLTATPVTAEAPACSADDTAWAQL